MKTRPAFRRLLSAFLFLCASVCSQAATENFEIRAAVPFAMQSLTVNENGSSWMLGSFSMEQSWNGTSWEAYASLTNVGIDPDAASQWTFSVDGWTATVDWNAMNNARNGGHLLGLTFEPPAGGNPAQGFLVSWEYTGHALGLVQPGNFGGPPMITPVSFSSWVWAYPSQGPSFSGMRASATVDPSKPFWITDFTTGLRAPTGATLIRDGWFSDPASYPVESVSFYLPAPSSGDRFTLHWQLLGQAEMVQSLTAAPGFSGWQQMGDWSWEDLSAKVCVTGNVALGATYWLTRDADGWLGTSRVLDAFAARPSPLRWSVQGMPALVNWQTITLHIASGMGWSANVVQPGGTRTLTPTYSGTHTLSDYDTWGNPHDFYYEDWTAQIDPTEPFWVTVWWMQGTQGDPWFYNGWYPLNGTPPNNQSVAFGIATGLGWNATVWQDFTSPKSLTLSGSGYTITDYVNGGPSDGAPNNFTYDLWNAVVDVNRPFFLQVNGMMQPANQTWFYNGWQWQGGTAPNWQTMSFSIASGTGWWNSSVTQTSGAWPLTPTWTSGYIEDYWNDVNGTPNFFYYDVFTALVDINRPFTLTVNGMALAQGETAFYNGWTWQGGAKKSAFTLGVTLHGDRASHDFTLTAPDNTTWPWSPGYWSWAGGSYAWFSNPWGMWSGSVWFSTVSSSLTVMVNANMNFGIGGGAWTLTDTTTGESQSFWPNGAGYYALDLSTWWLPPAPVALQISLSRWGHDLRIREVDGGEYYVSPGSSQGGLVQTPSGAWVESYYYFDGSSQRRSMSGFDWWVYDATTDEYAPPNTTDLVNWICPLQPANVAAVQTAVTSVEVRWQLGFNTRNELLGGGFRIERSDSGPGGSFLSLTSGNSSDFLFPQADGSLRFRYVDSFVPVLLSTEYTYRITYYYGTKESAPATANVTVRSAADFALLDSDGDGIPDAWELAHGMNPFDPSDALADWDGDGVTNRMEYQFGTDPNTADTIVGTNDPRVRLEVAGFAAP
jgi:hypothetical protein